MFSKAIVRTPGKSIVNGLTSASLGPVDYQKALVQHQGYIDALNHCGLEVICLDPDETFPDSTFVEDTALLTPHCAIITNPGAPSRQGEVHKIKEVVKNYYTSIEAVKAPGTVDAGDIMMVGSHYYIGISERTTIEGAGQVINILNHYGMTASTLELNNVLHLKTGVAYLENNTMVTCGEFISNKEFQTFKRLTIDTSEAYAANCVNVNKKVIIAKGYPQTNQLLTDNGFLTMIVDVSEFRKLDGGLSCLSLRF